jgi:hypothetical protein
MPRLLFTMLLTRSVSLGFTSAILSSSVAHMILENPVPYGKLTLNNSPLENAGSDFPCKLRAGVYDLTQMNYWTAGEPQTIRLLGSAVHGGGSCQFSVSEDLQPTKSSQWKVVLSVIGGCPANVEGNLPGGPTDQGAATFEVVLPKKIPNGKYTFAWTWFNRQGIREMYMNCAPISVSGGGNDPAFLASLPDMFVANLPSSACSTVENFDYIFPDPGDAVVTGRRTNLTTELVGAGCASMTALGGGSRTVRSVNKFSSSSSDQVSTTAKASSMITREQQSTALAEKVFAQGTMRTSNSQALVAETSLVLAAEGSIPASTSQATPRAESSTCVPCSANGEIICIDQNLFGLCNLGCARPQQLASGTVCFNGRILRRDTSLASPMPL